MVYKHHQIWRDKLGIGSGWQCCEGILRGEQPMTNYVLFKDNHEEPILWYDEKPGRVEVGTPSGRYLYCESIVTHLTGWHHTHYQFYRYRGFVDCQSDDWVVTEDIKEFCFKKEN